MLCRANIGRLILASASPRRKQLLAKLTGTNGFSVVASDFDERLTVSSPIEYAAACALGKASDVYKRTEDLGSRVVLGADTVVYAGGQILGKPNDSQEARGMLKIITGSEHTVITAVCLIDDSGMLQDFDKTFVYIDALNNEEINEYINTNSPFDKAGGYGIQDKIITTKLKYIRGSYDNVVGLPTELLRELLSKKGCL